MNHHKHIKEMELTRIRVMIFVLWSLWNPGARAQITTPCTTSMVSSFTPCLNFITGSSSGSGSGSGTPTADCCGALKEILTDSVDCACLLVTAGVPIQIPFLPPLSISLPRACKLAVSLDCKASASPLPAPGPALLGMGDAPSPSTPELVEAPAPDLTVVQPRLSPAIPPEAEGPTTAVGLRPFVNSSGSVLSYDVPFVASLLVLVVANLVATY